MHSGVAFCRRQARLGAVTRLGSPTDRLETTTSGVVYLPAVMLTLVNRRHLRANVFAERSANIWTIWAHFVNFTVALFLQFMRIGHFLYK